METTPLELLAGTKSITSMKDATISKSMVNFYSSYYFRTNDIYLGSPSDWGFNLGDDAVINLYEEKVFEGYIEDIDLISKNNTGSTIEIYGRDKTCDIADCEYDGTNREWKNQTVSSLCKNICDYFGIDIVVDPLVQSQANTKVTIFKANEGQSAYAMIKRLCDPLGILPYSKADGKLTLGRATTSDILVGAIERGKNVLSHEIRLSNRNRYSKYIVKGMGIGDDSKSIADWTECSGDHTDSVITRDRPHVIFADNTSEKGLCKNQAKWMAWNMGCLSRMYRYTVSGWKTDGGSLWDINKLIKVNDDWFDIDDLMLIVDVDFYLADGKSARTDITVVDKNCYSFSSKNVDVKMKAFDA